MNIRRRGFDAPFHIQREARTAEQRKIERERSRDQVLQLFIHLRHARRQAGKALGVSAYMENMLTSHNRWTMSQVKRLSERLMRAALNATCILYFLTTRHRMRVPQEPA